MAFGVRARNFGQIRAAMPERERPLSQIESCPEKRAVRSRRTAFFSGQVLNFVEPASARSHIRALLPCVG